MAESIVYLKVDSKFYDDRLKRAAQGMKDFEDKCREAGKSLADADKKTVEYIRAMGDMATVAQKPKQQLRELTDSILALTQSYQKLTDVEKQGDVGTALAESIDKLKLRASDLQDTIGDLNEELRHMASDTSFTDGINLMTRTIGSCTAAIVAWTGDSKEMEVVLKDLAKIGATVAAVEQLTKAFQKQNLVLLKNPYVIAAAAVAGMAVAIGALIKKQQELSAVEQDLQDVQTKARDNAAKEVTRIQTLNSILNDNTRSLDDRKAALAEIQTLVPAYHGALTTEGTLINNNTDALADYITNLQRAATAQAAFDRMVELQKQKMQQQLDLEKRQRELQSAQARNTSAQGQVVYAGTEMTQVYTQQGVTVAERAVQQAEADIRATNAEIDALRSLINANDLGTGSGVAKVTGTAKAATSGSSFKFNNPYEMPAAGSLADLEAQAATVRNSMGGAISTEEYQEMEQHLNTILAQIRELKGEIDVTFAPGSLNDLNQQLKDAQETLANLTPGTEAWANALADVAAKQAAVNELQTLIGQNTGLQQQTKDANTMKMSWTAAASAVAQVGGAMQQLDDPSAKIAGIIAQAIANVAAGLGQMLAMPQSTAQSWGWIALAISGTATMISTIAAIKSATSAPGFSEGGVVPGSSYSGDKIVARLNSGEGVLTQKGISNAANMAAALDAGGAGSAPSNPFVTGETIVLGINNFLGRSGQGEIVTTSMLRRAGVKL